MESSLSRQSEVDEAVRSAELSLTKVQQVISDFKYLPDLLENFEKAFKEARNKLDLALKEYELVEIRNNHIFTFLSQTENMQFAREKSELYAILTRWILQQIPLIELELKSRNMPEDFPDLNGADCLSGDPIHRGHSDVACQQGKERKRTGSDLADEERSPLRVKHVSSKSSPPNGKVDKSMDIAATEGPKTKETSTAVKEETSEGLTDEKRPSENGSITKASVLSDPATSS